MNMNEKIDRIIELTRQIMSMEAELSELKGSLGYDKAPLPRMLPSPPEPTSKSLAGGERCDATFNPFNKAPRTCTVRELKEEVRSAFLANPDKKLSLWLLANQMLHRDRKKVRSLLDGFTKSGFLLRGRAFAPTSNRTVDYWMLAKATAVNAFPSTQPKERSQRSRAGISQTMYTKVSNMIIAALTDAQNRPLTREEMKLSEVSHTTQNAALRKMVEDGWLIARQRRGGTGLPPKEYLVRS